jgi:ferredoxin
MLMKIVVDLNRCQCYAQCAFLAPSVFEIHGEEALMFAPLVPEQEHERVRRAALACPVQAIILDDDKEAGSHVR